MSVACYTTSVFEHTEILVSVKCSGDVNAESVQFVLNCLDAHKTVVINDAGCTINVKFSLDVSAQNCAWGAFQAHRQVYGLIYISEATNPMEAALIMDKFNKLKEEYGRGVYESRCLIFGIDTAIRQSHSHNIFQFSSHHAWKSIDYDIKQFVISIFYELESKRLKMSQEKISKPSLIFAPFESVEERTLEIDGKVTRKKFLGRHHKQLADIHLLLGLLADSLLCYSNALDMLISANDSVWVGCTLEGICVVSAIILLSELEGESSTQVKEKTSKFALDPRNLSSKQGAVSSAVELKKYCIPTIKDLVDKYREAIINYSRYKTLAVVELEACIKATKVFAKAKKFLEASEFIQNAVYITLNVPEPERLKRYSVMADLYKDINFYRKSFFYKRVAAMQCVAQLKNPDWKHCNALLLSAISGLSVDLSHFPYNLKGNGWPSVIQRVWRELVFSLERVGNHVLANRHLLHVFLAMFPFMTEADEKETCVALENYAKNHKENVSLPRDKFPFILDFYGLPVLKAVLPQIDVDGVRPIKSKIERSPQSVFIYTPTSHHSKPRDHRKIEFDWCANTPCQIDVEVRNPLAHSTLQVSDFSFVIENDSSTLDCPPRSFSVPPQMTSKISLIITPLTPGEVKIVGYAFQIFGARAKCYFEKNDEITMSEVVIDVIPELPLLKCTFSDETDARCDITSYCGEVRDLPFLVTNSGKTPVSSWMISCKTKPNEDSATMLFKDDLEGIVLNPGKTIALPIRVQPKSKLSAKALAELHPCTISIKYAAKLKDGIWWRSIDVDMELRFRQSVTVNHLTIKDESFGTSTNCLISATIRSFFEGTVEVHCYGDDKSINSFTLPPHSIRTCQMKLPKMTHSDKLTTKENIEDICLAHLKEKLNLTWSVSGDRELTHIGAVCFECGLSKDCICTMLNVPISCTISLNGYEIANSDADSVVQTNELCSVYFQFSNCGACPKTFNAQLEVYQDQHNGYIEWNLDESVLCLGSNSANVSVDPSGDYLFDCNIMFLKAGLYVVRATYDLNLTESKDPSANIQCTSPMLLITANP